jgi:hypothetical protein
MLAVSSRSAPACSRAALSRYLLSRERQEYTPEVKEEGSWLEVGTHFELEG